MVISGLMVSLSVNGMFVMRQKRIGMQQTARQRALQQQQYAQQYRRYGKRIGSENEEIRQNWGEWWSDWSNSQHGARVLLQSALAETQKSINAANSWNKAYLRKDEIEKFEKRLDVLQKQKQQYQEDLNRLLE